MSLIRLLGISVITTYVLVGCSSKMIEVDNTAKIEDSKNITDSGILSNGEVIIADESKLTEKYKKDLEDFKRLIGKDDITDINTKYIEMVRDKNEFKKEILEILNNYYEEKVETAFKEFNNTGESKELTDIMAQYFSLKTGNQLSIAKEDIDSLLVSKKSYLIAIDLETESKWIEAIAKYEQVIPIDSFYEESLLRMEHCRSEKDISLKKKIESLCGEYDYKTASEMVKDCSEDTQEELLGYIKEHEKNYSHSKLDLENIKNDINKGMYNKALNEYTLFSKKYPKIDISKDVLELKELISQKESSYRASVANYVLEVTGVYSIESSVVDLGTRDDVSSILSSINSLIGELNIAYSSIENYNNLPLAETNEPTKVVELYKQINNNLLSLHSSLTKYYSDEIGYEECLRLSLNSLTVIKEAIDSYNR